MVLCVAAITTIIFQKIRQPVVVGYLIAGLIVGPYIPPLQADPERIHTLSELGVILLMFALGLEFSVRKLIRLGPTSGFITALQVGLMLWLGYVCGRALGWTTLESIFTGALLSMSSTTIVAKAYEETPVSPRLRELVFGVLLAEDLTAVVELAILTTLASGASVSASLMTITVARLVLFLAVFVGVGLIVVPPFVRLVVRMGRPETTLVAVVGICFAFSILAEHAGYSVALGAFFAGSLVAESGESAQVEHLVAPLRDIFGAVFFVSVGMSIDPTLIEQHWLALIVLTATVVFGKIIGVTFASMLSGVGSKTAIEAGMSMAQIGEFSFIIAGAGLKSGATRDFLYTLTVAVSVVTTFMTPYMIRASIPMAEFVTGRMPRPLKVLEAFYDSWFERIRTAREPARDANSIGLPVAAIVSSAVLIGAILIVNELDPLDLTGTVASIERLSYFAASMYVDLFALLLCAAPAANHHAPEARGCREDDRHRDADRERFRSRPAEENAGDLHEREVDGRYDPAVEEQPEIDRTEAADERRRGTGVAKLVELEVGEHAGAAPQPCKEKDRRHPGQQERPPHPVLGDAAVAHQVRDEIRRVSGKGRRDERDPDQPPRRLPAGGKELGDVAPCAARQHDRRNETHRQRNDDDRPIQRREVHGTSAFGLASTMP